MKIQWNMPEAFHIIFKGFSLNLSSSEWMYCTIIALKVCSTHLKVSMDLVPGRSRGGDKVTYLENEVEWTETVQDCSTIIVPYVCICTATWISEEFTIKFLNGPSLIVMDVCAQTSLESNGGGNCKVLSLLWSSRGIHCGRHFTVICMQGELVTPGALVAQEKTKWMNFTIMLWEMSAIPFEKLPIARQI